MRAIAELGGSQIIPTAIATRGEHLVLIRNVFSLRDSPEPFEGEVLDVVEVSAGNQIAAHVLFDVDDVDAAIEELDARYIAGEGAAHARTWSVVTRAQAALDGRRELPPTTTDWVNLDHRRGIGFPPGDMTPFVRAGWNSGHDVSARIEVVHRLDDSGAVFVNVVNGTSTEGFDAEWRMVELMTVDGDLISRAEIFDETDLDTALARFDELSRPPHGWRTRRTKYARARRCGSRDPRLDRDDRDVGSQMRRTRIAGGSSTPRSDIGRELRDRRSARERRRRRHHVHIVVRTRDPWRTPRPHSCPLGKQESPQRVPIRRCYR